MNYSQKRTLIGRIAYVGLTAMAVTVLCVTVYTFFGASKEQSTKKPVITTAESVKKPQTTKPGSDDRLPEESLPADTEEKPTVSPTVKDWTKITLTEPVSGTIMKEHDPVNAVYSSTMNDYRVHKGIDVECNLGDDVLACAYGTVTSVGIDPFMGCVVTVDHGDGLISVYKNLAPELPEGITVGSEVLEGQVIGAVGESAIIEIADEPHLHIELLLNGKQVDPAEFFDYAPTVAEDTESTGK